MNTKLTIKNFRVFDENGVSVDLKPITILTGCNSSGKSSIVKAFLLLDSFLEQIKKAWENKGKIEINKYKLDFWSELHRQLGDFNSVVHRDSSLPKITFEYDVYSLMLSKTVTVKLVFAASDADGLKNGYLDSITLETEDGVFFQSDKNTENSFNFNYIKKEAVDFLIIDYVVHNYRNLHNTYMAVDMPQNEYEQSKKEMETFLNECNETRKNDIIQYVRKMGYRNDSIIHRKKVKPKILSWTKENSYSLFYIPVIEELNKIDKKEIKKYIDKKYLQGDDFKLKNYSYRIIDDFIDSQYVSLGEYFRDYEIEFLNNITIDSPFSLKEMHFFDFLDYNSIYGKGYDIINFELLYEVFMKWNIIEHGTENEYYCIDYEIIERNHHYMFNRLMASFASDLILEVFVPDWSGNVLYASSSRTKVKRLYSFDDRNDFEKLLEKYFFSKWNFYERGEYHKDKDYKLDSFINYWIKEKFGIGDRIELQSKSGLGVIIKLYKTAEDKSGRPLADEGYGITSLFGLLLQIEIAIRNAKGSRNFYDNGLDNLDGYDSQKFHYEPQIIAIEEPEIHLHPSFQSLLAEMFLDVYKKYNIRFIIETHSEYLIRRLQLLTAGIGTESRLDKNDVSIFYVYSREVAIKEGLPLVKSISIRDNGYLSDTFGNGFFDEATNLSRKLM